MRVVLAILALLIPLTAIGCARPHYFPQRATEPYPAHLHTTNTVDIQVFRESTQIEIVNATGESYHDFWLWINQRYARQVSVLRAGERRRFSLWDFYDERGETMNAGGFWRFYEPDPVRLVQIQLDEHTPLIGLIAVREERLAER